MCASRALALMALQLSSRVGHLSIDQWCSREPRLLCCTRCRLHSRNLESHALVVAPCFSHLRFTALDRSVLDRHPAREATGDHRLTLGAVFTGTGVQPSCRRLFDAGEPPANRPRVPIDLGLASRYLCRLILELRALRIAGDSRTIAVWKFLAKGWIGL